MDFERFIQEQEARLRCFDSRPLPVILSERKMPKPLWGRRPMTDSGDFLLDRVRKAASKSPAQAFCVYIHVPWCRTRCGYCDCYSFPLTSSRIPDLAEYPDLIGKEIKWWAENVPTICEKPLTTVHFGGGTPLTLGVGGLQKIIETILKYFNVTQDCEFALESTSADLNEKILHQLKSIGFKRLHIGVQTLHDQIRKMIGRHETGEQVLDKIRCAVESDWVVSTDIIIGLPGYREELIAADMTAMIEAGVEGFSIYELVRSPRNRIFFERLGIGEPDFVAMWQQYQYAFWLADAFGYRLKIYNHMAKERDENRYFTSPLRGEDLLSFGTIADGYFGDYLYRHAELPGYIRDAADGKPGLAGGMERSSVEKKLARLERELRGGTPFPDPFIEILGPEKALRLFQNWVEKGFLVVTPDGEHTRLLPSGSWSIQKMIEDCKK